MNRLIIIGNGFDLAHGLKTGIYDFLEDYFRKVVIHFFSESYFEDELFELRSKAGNKYKDTLEVDFDVWKKMNYFTQRGIFEVNFKFQLLKVLYENVKRINWVNVEQHYFEELLKIRNGFDVVRSVKEYNTGFDVFKSLLIKYLEDQQTSFNTKSINFNFLRYIRENIETEDKVSVLNSPRMFHILNFNYTNIAYHYTRQLPSSKSSLNHIHGKLGSVEHAPIFGFGDEIDTRYTSFENERDTELYYELLKHIKSFEYLKTSSLNDLNRFIGSDKYQVYIFGHSCGITDRTLLSQIFEHENCSAIKIFYYKKPDGTDDYMERCFEINRHIRDKIKLREKVVPKDKSQPMPQPFER